VKRILQSAAWRGLAVLVLGLGLIPALPAQSTGDQARSILGQAIANQEKPGELQGALQKLEALAGHGTSDATLEYARGWVLSHVERPVDAVAAYRHAIALDPTLAAAHYNLGVLLSSNPTTKEESLRYFEAAARLDPRNADASYNAGQADYDLERYGAALAQWRHTQLLTPDDFQVARKLVQTLNALGLWTDAAVARDYALRILRERRDPSALNTTSLCVDQLPLKMHRVYVYENLDPASPNLVYFCRIINARNEPIAELDLIRDGESHHVLRLANNSTDKVPAREFSARPPWPELKPIVSEMTQAVLQR
jgi:tetratricopeptide (TPR) repeat protein